MNARDTATEHARTAYTAGDIEYHEFDERLDLALRKPEAYLEAYTPKPAPPVVVRKVVRGDGWAVLVASLLWVLLLIHWLG